MAQVKTHPRVPLVNGAEGKLRKVLSEIRETLTEPEFLGLIAGLFGEQVGIIATYALRRERHGREDKPGDWE